MILQGDDILLNSGGERHSAENVTLLNGRSIINTWIHGGRLMDYEVSVPLNNSGNSKFMNMRAYGASVIEIQAGAAITEQTQIKLIDFRGGTFNVSNPGGANINSFVEVHFENVLVTAEKTEIDNLIALANCTFRNFSYYNSEDSNNLVIVPDIGGSPAGQKFMYRTSDYPSFDEVISLAGSRKVDVLIDNETDLTVADVPANLTVYWDEENGRFADPGINTQVNWFAKIRAKNHSIFATDALDNLKLKFKRRCLFGGEGINVQWFGAISDCILTGDVVTTPGTDNLEAFNETFIAAVDSRGNDKGDVYLPAHGSGDIVDSGVYRVSGTIEINRLFAKVRFWGDQDAAIFADFWSGGLINLGEQRKSEIWGLVLIGKSIVMKTAPLVDFRVLADVMDASVDITALGLYSAITVDGNGIGSGSKGIQVHHCNMRNFACGVNISAAGDIQGDHWQVWRNWFDDIGICVSVGGDQARNGSIFDNEADRFQTFVDNANFGTGGGSMMNVMRNQVAVGYQFMDYATQKGGGGTIQANYIEFCGRIGRITGSGNSNDLAFVGGQFKLQPKSWDAHAKMLEGTGRCTWTGVSFDLEGLTLFWFDNGFGDSGNVFNQCTFISDVGQPVILPRRYKPDWMTFHECTARLFSAEVLMDETYYIDAADREGRHQDLKWWHKYISEVGVTAMNNSKIPIKRHDDFSVIQSGNWFTSLAWSISPASPRWVGENFGVLDLSGGSTRFKVGDVLNLQTSVDDGAEFAWILQIIDSSHDANAVDPDWTLHIFTVRLLWHTAQERTTSPGHMNALATMPIASRHIYGACEEGSAIVKLKDGDAAKFLDDELVFMEKGFGAAVILRISSRVETVGSNSLTMHTTATRSCGRAVIGLAFPDLPIEESEQFRGDLTASFNVNVKDEIITVDTAGAGAEVVATLPKIGIDGDFWSAKIFKTVSDSTTNNLRINNNAGTEIARINNANSVAVTIVNDGTSVIAL